MTVSDIKILVETINQKMDGMANRIAMVERHANTVPLNNARQEATPVRNNPHLGTQAQPQLSAGRPKPNTSGVRPQSPSENQTTRSDEEGLSIDGDLQDIDADHLDKDDHIWAMELQAHRTHIT